MIDRLVGWKRKLGVAVLAVACLLTAHWLRSDFCSEMIEVIRPSWRLECVSRKGVVFIVCRMTAGKPYEVDEYPVMLTSMDGYSRWIFFSAFVLGGARWQWTFAEFGFATGPRSNFPDETMYICMAPYWSIAIPPTLFSACLLLSGQALGRPCEHSRESSLQKLIPPR